MSQLVRKAINELFSRTASYPIESIGRELKDSRIPVTQLAEIDLTGATDATAGLITALSNGGDLYIPDGDFLIASAGPDAGGVYVTITKTTRVTCGPKVRFFTNAPGLDNDMIRFTVPADGVGLPAGGIEFEWWGGYFDQTNQKGSTTMPFAAGGEYPSVNPGASATCDALSIRGDYLDGGVPRFGIMRAMCVLVSTYAGDHWETAGGDGAIFMGGCKSQSAHFCRHVGARDLGVYFSGDETGVLRCKSVSIGGYHENCFGGVSTKRSSGDFSFVDNTFINCPRAIAVEHLIGSGARKGRISGNTFEGCGILARVTYASGVTIADNHAIDSGALLEDGVTAESLAGLAGWQLRGCTRVKVRGNTMNGVKAAPLAAYLTQGEVFSIQDYDPGTGAVQTTKCSFIENWSSGWRSAGTDNGDGNSFIRNEHENTIGASNTVLGTNAHEVRVDSSNVQIFNTPVQFNDGSLAAPAIARRGNANTGIRFGANMVGIGAGGQDRFTADANGIGFFGTAAVARSAAAAVATDLATVITLANDLRAKLVAYGLAT